MMDRSRTPGRGREIGSCELGLVGLGPVGTVVAGMCARAVIVGLVDVGEGRKVVAGREPMTCQRAGVWSS